MMRRSFYITASLLAALFLTLSGLFTKIYAEEEIAFDVTPDDVLFDVHHMKPGDWAPRIVTIKNQGTDPFQYNMKVESQGGIKLYNELYLEVTEEDRSLYDGKLKDFTSMEARRLAPKCKDEITMTVRFPKELGNEYQGMETNFSIVFTVEGDGNTNDEQTIIGKVGTDLNDVGPKLPNTATGMFIYILLGLILVGIGGFFILISYKVKNTKRRELSWKDQ
ncbi:LPXTG cell wall anchor domain-containing protein [Virgibacillus pantothenticus]|uniref:LPXTG cell wall anchor domain-containing protein n=2 Tax=Virgibacillus pantothenticus TaxID=1473 RepID=UPI001C215456|nr:LPXTG cell wall anchor domain-containing protein [Virgibacillus pantothenticus]MBU8566247.1 LPXTG cell wall anchor domain-containing protein [Virgibacillus pantothenticus]MBU8600672.1 LPXTG cell wall anchor domain-containing protein [Virgibacillus pantothenticus]MBU8634620.1 LPXTG cell wall anchor domain-containing protein [Virgibacillus pantothenticus]MBU8646468.1 LPXTG cell wall anchor domain-containing protein [Virgibacillus pantothenticus]MBU8660128.1 LPXTG cell wall anchor domain-conta